MSTNDVKALTSTFTPEQQVAGSEGLIVRASAAFTASYVASDSINIENVKSMLIWIALNGTGIANSQLKIQFADDDEAQYFDYCNFDTDGKTLETMVIEMGATSGYYCFGINNPGAQLMRLSVKANAAAGAVALIISRGQGSSNVVIASV